MHDSLGDRMKGNYEDRARSYLTRRIPVIIRVDGKAFHTLTKKADKPFDDSISAMAVASEMQGFKAGFIQSDEASFLLMDTDQINTEAWFDYNQQKLASVSAALMTGYFNNASDWHEYKERVKLSMVIPVFDARAFNIPEAEVANYFLWRAKDWERNSISMFARSHYSHKQLHGKGRAATLEMLEKDGHRWNELPEQFRNGSWISRSGVGITYKTDVLPTYQSINSWSREILHPILEDFKG